MKKKKKKEALKNFVETSLRRCNSFLQATDRMLLITLYQNFSETQALAFSLVITSFILIS